MEETLAEEWEGIAHMSGDPVRREDLRLSPVGSRSRRNWSGHVRWR